MGMQTVSSQNGSGNNGRGGDQSQVQGLVREGSLYSLTLNEVENHLGEPLHSMNLDDLLKSVFPAETNQNLSIDFHGGSGQYAVSSSLHRQGSVTMPRSLSKKTVDEVWKDIQQGKKGDDEEERNSGRQKRQGTLGEMTLEDFLVKAGVVAEGIAKDANELIANPAVLGNTTVSIAGTHDFVRGAQWLPHYPQMSMEQHIQGQHGAMGAYMLSRPVPQLGVGGAPIPDSVFPDSSPSLGTLSDTQTPGRKRGAPGAVEDKLVERRQKRMIKNRESAARSRARKQAYTNELENKVIRLEEENERLRKQQELDKILYTAPAPEPKYRLRRTSSALF